jgi:hypothetical protein
MHGGLPIGRQITGTHTLSGTMSWIPPKNTGSATADRSRRGPLPVRMRLSIRGAKQLLTPAPTLADVAWKRAKVKSDEFKRLPITQARAEQAIADDLAFLAAHPTRRSNSEAMAHNREFKEAMRQRIRDIAASRDLSDEEIKPALTLKHHEFVKFTEKHGVNLEWLLEGRGRVFEKDPIRLGPNATGAEFVAVVRTMPTADQRAIEAMVSEMVQERDQ